MDKQQLLKRLEKAWVAFKESYAGLSAAQMTEPGVTEGWSVRDLLVHVSIWEEEAIKHLPLILTGGRPPRYSVTYGGIDAFNGLTMGQRKDIPLANVLAQQEETHQRLIDYIQSVPEEQFTGETRFRRRLRLDTYSHYPIHTKAIHAWRDQLSN